jgi:methyl acetate hydrolase
MGFVQQPTLDPVGCTRMSRFLAEAVQRGDVPGIVALVVDRDRVVFESASGKSDVANGVEMTANAIFRIASMTKPITTVGALLLVEKGELALDDPVSRYLPTFENAQVINRFNPADGRYDTRASARTVTIRHLLTHTAGIGYGFSNPVVLRLLQGTQKSELDIPLLHDPGEKWTYGASTLALGMVIETVSGLSLDVFLKSRIFDPLGMSDTSFSVAPENTPRVVTVHRRTESGLVEQANPVELQSPARGDGGLCSTAQDYGTFLQMLLNGGSLGTVTILSRESVAAMGENQIGNLVVEEQPAANPAVVRPFPLGAGRDRFGFGFQITEPDERYAGMRTPGSLSWAGINNTHFWIDPSRGIAAVVLMQLLPFYDEAAIRTLHGFEEIVYASLS